MFASISINPIEGKGKGVNENTFKNKKHQINMGMPQWQQEWTTVKQREFSAKPVKYSYLISVRRK
jgi:hypothetical protein